MVVRAMALRGFLVDINHAEERPMAKKNRRKKNIIYRVVNLADTSMQIGRWTIKGNNIPKYKLNNRLYLVKHLQDNKIFFSFNVCYIYRQGILKNRTNSTIIVVMCNVTYKKVCTIKLSLSLLLILIFFYGILLLLIFL